MMCTQERGSHTRFCQSPPLKRPRLGPEGIDLDEKEPRQDHEIEFLLKDPKSYKQGQSVHSHSKTLHGCFTFRLLVFPMGTEVTSPPPQLAAFVEAVPPPGCDEIRWHFEGVRYQITAVNWKDYRKSTTQQETHYLPSLLEHS
eukprot:g18289.t1